MRKFKIFKLFEDFILFVFIDIDGRVKNFLTTREKVFIEFSTRRAVVRMTAAKFSRDPKTDGGGHPLQIFSRDFGVALAKPL